MIVHQVATRIRRLPLVRRQTWFWHAIEPGWNRVLGRATRTRGMPVWINGDRLRLDYEYGARYESTGYEPLVHEAFTSGIRRGMVVLDVGAHIGFFTLAAALRVGSTGRVFAFEPSPATAAVLERHVAMNGYEDRVEIVRAVASDESGSVPFFTHGETMAASLSPEHVMRSPEGFTSPATRVEGPSVTLDEFCRSRSIAPDRVKIDVEGAEALVLRGARGILSSSAEIVCELHPATLPALGTSLEEVQALVAESGRGLQRIDEPNDQGIYHALLARTPPQPNG